MDNHLPNPSPDTPRPEVDPSPASMRTARLEPIETGDAPRPPRRPLLLAAILLLLAALIALSTWWVLGREDSGGQAGPGGLSRQAIQRILTPSAASTPAPLAVRTQVVDRLGDLTYAPDSEHWSPALRDAQRDLDDGRYSGATAKFAALVSDNSSQEDRDALWGLAASLAGDGRRDQAIAAYSLFAGLDDPRAARAIFRVAQLQEESGRPELAARAYRDYAGRGGPAANPARLRAAEALGDTPEAQNLYNEVLSAKPGPADLRQALSGLAALKAKRGDHAGALTLYDRLAAERRTRPDPSLDEQAAPAEVPASQEAMQLGDTAGAKKRLLTYIKSGGDNYSGLFGALQAFLEIDPQVVTNGSVPPILAANIAYAAGDTRKTIEFLDTLRAVSPTSPDRPAAALLTGKAYDRSGDSAGAYNWYTATLQTYPASNVAPEAIRRAGDALTEQASWDSALGTYTQAVEQYPNSGGETALARIHGGVLAYRLGLNAVALAFLRPASSAANLAPGTRAEALFWTGKVEKAGGDAAWKTAMQEVSRLDPSSYLDFRAKALLAGEAAGGPLVPTFRQSGVQTSTLGVQYAAEAAGRTELLAWAARLPASRPAAAATPTAGKQAAASPTSLTAGEGLEPRLAQDPAVQRAIALLNLDDSGTRAALLSVGERLAGAGDSMGLAELVLYARYHASANIAMNLAMTLASMDTLGDPLRRPPLLLKTLYPSPWAGVVTQESSARDLDPLLMYAMVRQESEFVSDARSWADARGLAQVMPSTGEGIASALGDTGYTTEDLYLPYVALRFGTYYVGSNLAQFDRKLMPVVAAYNGGPGNASRWMDGSALFDPDLYGERIDLFETADYLERVYRNYGFYKSIYTP